MNFEKYTQKAQEAVSQSQQIALEFSHQSIEPAHLLLALLRQQEGTVSAIVTQVSGSVSGLLAEVEKDLESRPKVYGGSGSLGASRTTADVFTNCQRHAGRICLDRTSAARTL